ncbi:MAG: hypothetical protein M3068_00220 [Gemmatimonadota bacterium]|nr:hypothetical protein [Gemmatimonadota bacterium]
MRDNNNYSSRGRQIRRLATTASVLLSLVACAKAARPTDPNRSQGDGTGADSTVASVSADGLVQTVHLSRNPVAQGELLSITATLRNARADSVRVYRGYPCRLDLLETDLQFSTPECLPPTAVVWLAPGDSVTSGRGGVVGSSPGSYTVRVRQAVDADLTASVTVHVTMP